MKTIFILFLLLTASAQYGFSQTDSSQMQPATEQTEQTGTEQTPQDENAVQNSYDIQPESVQIADPSEGSSYVTSPGQSAGYQTETIRYYSGSHSGNNVTKTVEVPKPDGSTTQSPY